MGTIPNLLDIGFPHPDPAVTVQDADDAGAEWVALYVLNWSAPGTVQTPEYAHAVAAGGKQVLPIITPGMTPPAVSGSPAVLDSWPANRRRAVGCDLEQPGIDTPPGSWVLELGMALEAANYRLWIYTNLRQLYPWFEWWAVDWDHGDLPRRPASAIGVQWGIPFIGRRGQEYDQSLFLPAVLSPGPAPEPAPEPAPIPQEDDDDMKGFIVVNDAGTQFCVTPEGRKFGLASLADKDAVMSSGQYVDTGRKVTGEQLAQWPDVNKA